MRVASDKAKLGFNFSKLALHPGMAASFFLPKLVGLERANYLLMTGELVSGSAAKGIISRLSLMFTLSALN